MFPTLGHLINYLQHTHLQVPVQTLGLFMMLAFVFAYFVFTSEFKRKEADGSIKPFTRKVLTGAPASLPEILLNGFLGFLFGFKILWAALRFHTFLADPKGFILSWQGSIICGIIVAIAFAGWIWYDRKKDQLADPKLTEELVHPYQLMPRIVISVAVAGFIGAKLFDMAEHLDALKYDPIGTIFSVNGFTYLGGLIFGAFTYLYICHKRGMKLSYLADIGSPGMMLAYAIGRIGCELSGDGDWGIINNHPKPNLLQWLPDWAWSATYAHNQANIGVSINNCYGDFCKVLPQGVFPTSLYEIVLCLLLFGCLWMLRKRIRKAGLLFYIYLLMNSTERFLIETIRVNQRYSFLGLNLTQAQWLCVAMFAGGLIGIGAIVSRKIEIARKLQYR